MSAEEMAIYILEYCSTWRSVDEISKFADRDKDYIRNKVSCICDDGDSRDVCLYVVKLVKFDTAFPVMQFRPPIDRQAERYGRRVERIHLIRYKEVLDAVPLLSGNSHHAVCKLLEDSDLTYFIGFTQIAASDALAEAQVMECRLERSQRDDEVTKSVSIRQLTEEENQ
jgi:hypothetical protein